MPRAFISIGSNIDPGESVRKAMRLLARRTKIKGISTVYLTAPEGRPEQPDYYNLVVEIETDRSPLELKYRVLRKIEEEMGRMRVEDRSAPRIIDLDLILYDDLVIDSDDIELPDPQIANRPFLAVPLKELDPDLVLPGTGVRISEAAARMGNRMKPLEQFTESLRSEIHGR